MTFLKKPLLLCFLLSLCACIDVDDFSAYWDKGAVDLGLVGTWNKIDAKRSDDWSKSPGADAYRFTPKGDTLKLEAYNNGQKEEEERPLLAKTIRIKSYTFLMVGPEQGFIYRYEVKGNMLTGYSLNSAAAYRFMKQKYPDMKNISSTETGFVIDTFDASVEKVLGSIPDTKVYWTVDNRYRKVK